MAGVDKRLTDLTEKVSVPDTAWIHVVDPSDISQNAAGSSFKVKKLNFGGLSEAPIDGITYGRKDGSWVEAAGDIITTTLPVLLSDLTTPDTEGIRAYINDLSPNVVVAANEILRFKITDTEQLFELNLHGVTVGLGQTAITEDDVTSYNDFWDNPFLNTYQVISRGDATLTVLGAGAFSATGTASVIGGGTGVYNNIKQKTGVTSATATAGSTCGYRDGGQTVFNFMEGFKMTFKFSNSDAALVADARTFVGCINNNTLIGNVNPSTLVNMFGLASDNGETELSIMHNDNAGTATKIPLGANFPANTSKTDVYRVTFMTFPNTNVLHYKVKRLNTGHTAEGEITTDMTFSATGFAPHFWRNSGATALAVNQTFISLIAKFYH